MAPISRNDEFMNKEDEGDIVEFQTLLTEGKQAYISGRFKEAEVKLSEAAELSVNIYGYFAIPTFDPHLYYGKTLLELARLEDGVFSNALKSIATTDEETCKNNEKDEGVEKVESFTEERDEAVKKVNNALEENAETLEKKIACYRVNSSNMLEENKEEYREEDNNADKNEISVQMKSESDTEKTMKCRAVRSDEMECEGETMGYKENGRKTEGKRKDNNMEDEEREEKEIEGEDSKDEVSEEVSVESDNKDESTDSGDVEYLQLAWENLEVARTICDKHLEEEGWKEKKVEVLLDLADCATDAENYKQAIDDIDACILLSESIFGGGDRRVAQAYFVKGRTHNLSKDFGNAAKVFGKSKEILEDRLAKLEAQIAHESQGETEKIMKEIDELKSLLPEIQIKIDDSLESARSLTKEIIAANGNENEVSLKLSIKGMPVDDVSSLVRKKLKRSAEDEEQKKAKRIKGDNNPGNAS
ncbi:unnamed protein product [Litomosoides sigmodontis]|uniref:Tetratricopeptide SHNi-TPR domain-containing protein n=1 Tax=Litomosoides sigmodontis TaxID=42156 RepID=A0A3P6TSN9_LITSI|nr:unnamed protein product [Litomosoides sigmodontis]